MCFITLIELKDGYIIIFIQLSFNVWTRNFKYKFHAKENRDSEMAKKFPTEIFVPKLQYPNMQYAVETSKDLTWTLSPFNEDIIQIFVVPHRSSFGSSPPSKSYITIKPTSRHHLISDRIHRPSPFGSFGNFGSG